MQHVNLWQLRELVVVAAVINLFIEMVINDQRGNKMIKTSLLVGFAAILVLVTVNGNAAESKKVTVDLQKGYQLAKKKCVGCHDSVANPEAGRKTRDDWHVVVDVMHQQFQMKMTKQEKELLIDYFYNIRKGLEKDPG